jgi:hypothetical protein
MDMIKALGAVARAGSVAALLAAATHAQAADKPVFGFVMPFSGWFQPIDADTIAGAKLAISEVNTAGGVLGQPIAIAEFDNKPSPRSAPTAPSMSSARAQKPSCSQAILTSARPAPMWPSRTM